MLSSTVRQAHPVSELVEPADANEFGVERVAVVCDRCGYTRVIGYFPEATSEDDHGAIDAAMVLIELAVRASLNHQKEVHV